MKRVKDLIQYIVVAASILFGFLFFWKTNQQLECAYDESKEQEEDATIKSQSVSEWLDLKNNPYAPLIIGCGGFLENISLPNSDLLNNK